MDAKRIRHIDAYCRHGFDYLTDVVDTWRSHLAEVRAGKRWQGDCDDLTSTTLDALGHAGLRLEERWRICVSTNGSNLVDHMIGCARDNRGGMWIVGDTFGACYPAVKMTHRALVYQRMDLARTPTWYLGKPF